MTALDEGILAAVAFDRSVRKEACPMGEAPGRKLSVRVADVMVSVGWIPSTPHDLTRSGTA